MTVSDEFPLLEGVPKDPEFEQAVERYLDQERARREARRRIAREEGLDTLGSIPAGTSLTDLLAEPRPPVRYRIDGLWPSGGRVMLVAQKKAGKTTVIGNVLRSILDGDEFMGRFAATPVKRVALIDTELNRSKLAEWLGDQEILNTDRLETWSIRDNVGTFNLLDDDHLAVWAEKLRGVDVVILDCLRPVMDAIGLDEHREAGRILVAFDRLLGECGASEGVIVQHMGHSGERARGDSRLGDWPDASWKILMENPDDEQSARYFSAFGRDVELPEADLHYNRQSRRVTLGTESRAARKRERAQQRKAAEKDEKFLARVKLVREAIAANGGKPLSGAAVIKLLRENKLGVRNGAEAEVIEAALKDLES